MLNKHLSLYECLFTLSVSVYNIPVYNIPQSNPPKVATQKFTHIITGKKQTIFYHFLDLLLNQQPFP